MKKTLFFLVLAIISYFSYIKFYLIKINENQFLLLFFVIFILFFFCYYWYFWYFKKARYENYLKSEAVDKLHPLKELKIGLLAGTTAVFISHFLYFIFEHVTFFSDRLSFQLVYYAIIFSFGASVMEEIFFRGLLQGALRKIFKNPVFAPIVILPVACVFAYMHKRNLSELYQARILLVLLSGIILGLMAYITNALWSSMGAHFTWNFFHEISFGYDQKLFGEKLGVLGSPENAQIYAIIVLGSMLLIWIILIGKKKKMKTIANRK